MISQQELDMEAAMLAASVSGQLNMIDKVMDSPSRISANRLDINQIVNSVRSGRPIPVNKYDPANQGYVPESMVQSMVPDTSEFSSQNITTTPPPQAFSPTPIQPKSSTPQVVEPLVELSLAGKSKIEEELVLIRSLMEKMNGNLSKMAGMMGKVFCNINDKTDKN